MSMKGAQVLGGLAGVVSGPDKASNGRFGGLTFGPNCDKSTDDEAVEPKTFKSVRPGQRNTYHAADRGSAGRRPARHRLSAGHRSHSRSRPGYDSSGCVQSTGDFSAAMQVSGKFWPFPRIKESCGFLRTEFYSHTSSFYSPLINPKAL